MTLFLALLQTASQILTAGIAITAFSLLVYALTFNLRDRVARSFMLILLWITLAFTGEALGTVAGDLAAANVWFRFQWVGLIFLPASYFHFSDAILATTGRPSRGRRSLAVRMGYFISLCFLVTLPLGLLVGDLQAGGNGLIYLQRTPLTWLFTAYYILGFSWAWSNFYRAYQRAFTSTSRRRMRYLLTGALAPALGSFPYLVFGARFALENRLLFWLLANAATIVVFWFLVSMAYAVAFFGTPWPDRVVKRRLAQWLLRGPVTASVTLGLTTLARRGGATFGAPDTILTPLVMVLTVLLLEHLITVFAPLWEAWLFERERDDDPSWALLQNLEDRFMTASDIRQFLESVLAAVCDQCQSNYAFAAEVREGALFDLVAVGAPGDSERLWEMDAEGLLQLAEAADYRTGAAEYGGDGVLAWGDFWVLPLHPVGPLRYAQGNGAGEGGANGSLLLGILGVRKGAALHEEQVQALLALGRRAALALEDRRLQEQIFTSLRGISPQVEQIQRLRAASRYNRTAMLSEPETLPDTTDITQAVRDALSHYWGGPKLTSNPLLELQVVQKAVEQAEGNPANAVRAVLKEAVQRLRPEGDRRFTTEWTLYNILDMKFLEGRRGRDVAKKLALSEADLYRKQRVAIEAVAVAILEMEREAAASHAPKAGPAPTDAAAKDIHANE